MWRSHGFLVTVKRVVVFLLLSESTPTFVLCFYFSADATFSPLCWVVLSKGPLLTSGGQRSELQERLQLAGLSQFSI